MEETPIRRMIVKEVNCKSILVKSGIKDIDYALNPYIGCGHGCTYCYAVFMKRFTGHKEPWGRFVDVKVNAAKVLREQLRRVRPGVISFGTVTDSYQPIEAKYEITLKCLEELIDYDHPINILTKSPLVLRDIDVLKRMKNVDVGFTVTSLDERVKLAFEPSSSSSKERLDALYQFSCENIKSWLFFGPVLPYFSDSEEAIDDVFAAAAEAEADYVLVDHLRPYPTVWAKVRKLIRDSFPEAVDTYEDYYRNRHGRQYKEELRRKASKIAKRRGLACRFGF